MNNDAKNLVNDLLNILQPDAPAEKSIKKQNAEKQGEKNSTKQPVKATLIQKKGGKLGNVMIKEPLSVRSEFNLSASFLDEIDETVKNTQNAKVVIRKDLYEVFMSIKRVKQVKSVSTLLDYALEDYIKRNSESIKKLLYESKKHEIL